MRIPFVHHKLVILVAIGLIIISTATLSFLSYHWTVGRENLMEASLWQAHNSLAWQHVDQIEQKLIENDGILSEMIDVDEPSKWPEMVEAIKNNAELNVDQVYFIRPENDHLLYPPISDQNRTQWTKFRAGFKLKELNLGSLRINEPHHLHKDPDYFFATYVLRETQNGSRILVCYQMSFDRITLLLDRYIRSLTKDYFVSIVDFSNKGVYGQPISEVIHRRPVEARFQSTLYQWILQIVPRNYTEIESTVRNQRRTYLVFIIMSVSTIFFSLMIIYSAWQRDRQLRQLKEDFISNVSHELKTPLSLIRMFSEILVTGRVKSGDKKLEYYRIIYNESDRMSHLINNLLDFANLVRGIEHKHFEKTNLGQVVTKALEAYHYEVQKDGFQLTLETEPEIPDCYVDSNAVVMALFNLLDNSVKYSGDQKQITVRVTRKDGFIDLSVTDKGVGIAPSEQQKIFDQFYRGADPTIRRIRGSGIGLAITRHVAELHGGDVLVESVPGKGSTFTLHIPIRDDPNDSKSEIRDSRLKEPQPAGLKAP